jgi:hypothetical protein
MAYEDLGAITLAEWAVGQPYIVREHHVGMGVMHVPDSEILNNRWQLFCLADYVVSSVTAGTIWLCPRRLEETK